MILFLFTTSYPFDSAAEQTFLGAEIRHLKDAFDRVIIVPRELAGNRLSLPDGVDVNEDYAVFLKQKQMLSYISAVFSPFFYSDIFFRPSILLHRKALKRLISFIGRSGLTKQWVENWFNKSSINPVDCIFYTFWFDDAAMGIGLAKKKYPEIRMVTRTHGYDLYEERHEFPYWPLRRIAISLMDRILPDSDAGTRYLQSRYPKFQSLYETGFLGVSPASFKTASSADGTFRIVSCSMLVPVKRLHLLIKGITDAALKRPDIQFLWTHFGNGFLKDELKALADSLFPSNARVVFAGYSSQEELYDFYKNNPIDVFVNVSSSEGTPVSIMEAISCGIPAMATNVGGNPEIVSDRNGILISSDPTPEEIAAALLSMWDNPEVTSRKRKESFEVWEEKFNAEANFRKFADLLIRIRKS